MKTQYLIICIFAFAFPFCNMNTVLNNPKKTESFEQKLDDKNSNRLELIYDTDSIRGVFYGVEYIDDDKIVNYKSILDDLKIDGNKISFILNKYMVSDENSSINSFPDILKFPQNFNGERKSDTLILRRTSIIYDSSFDEFIFFLNKSED